MDDFEVVRGSSGASAADVHLVARGAEVTLCSRPTTGLLAADETVDTGADVPMCWVCRATAQV